MKRPKTSNKKISWFSIASVFLLAIALAVGVTSSAQAATGSLDRDNYLPDLTGSSGNDFDRAWISVTDSSGNTSNSADAVTVTIKAGSNSSSFVLKETGGTTTVFTTTGSTQPTAYPVGTTSGYAEDAPSGSHNYPGLGTSVIGLNLRSLSGNTGGSALTGSSGELTVESGNTLELLYGGSTLDTAIVNTNSGSFSFTPSAVTSVSTDTLGTANLIVKVTDPDENINPVIKDVIGFADGFAVLPTGTGSSRVQIEALDQTTGSRLSLSSTEIVARNIVLVETGNSTGVFTASGKAFGSSTPTIANGSQHGNLLIGSATTTWGRSNGAYYYQQNNTITLGSDTSSNADNIGCTFRIIETNAPSGRIGLYNARGVSGSITSGIQPLTVLGFTTGSDFTSKGTSTFGIAGVTTNTVGGAVSTTRVVAIGTTTVLFGEDSVASNQGTNSARLLKLMEGSFYCLVRIESFGSTTGWITATTPATNTTYETGFAGGGSATVAIDSFQLAGPRSGDTLKVSYLDELDSGGTTGTLTGTLAYGVSGVTGTLAFDNTAPDINDFVTVTVVDSNLNESSSSKGSVAAGSSLFGGTTTNRRGDHLTVKGYSTTTKKIDLSHPDGFIVGTQTIRISSTDNTYVWMVPTSAFSITTGSPLTVGSTTISLGTQSVSGVPLVRGSSSGATSFLTSASTSSFVATLDGLDNTVEISPDGTRWVSIPIVETGANSSTFKGTIGFDYTAVRLTTNTQTLVSTLITDSTGTTTIIFPGGDIAGNPLTSFIGTGSVVRVFDGTTQEFAEVCSVAPTTLSVTKLANSVAYDPDLTWVQVIGNDMMTERLETLSDESVISRVGGYYGATYRFRYNDAIGASGTYLGGDTLAATTSNMGFTTYTGSLSTDVTGTSGPDTWITVTLVDQDLNTSVENKQTTFENDSATGRQIFWNENGLGLPSGSSTGNVSRVFKNGGTAKIVYASKTSSILSTSVDLSSGGNTVDFGLVETANNAGTFKGSFRISSGSTTANADDVVKVTNGDSIYVFYNDSPNATSADNSSSYTTTSPISIVTSLGSLSLSKETAYLSGDTIVATVVDVDRNISLSTEDIMTTALKVTGANYSVGTDLVLNLKETGVNTGTFLATITSGTTTVNPTSYAATANSGTVKAVQDGTANVIYTDTSPSGQSATKTLSFSAYNATLDFGADLYSLGSYATVTLTDKERNTSNTVAQSLLSDVFIQTSTSNSTKVRMVENGIDTGTFLGSIQVVSSGGTSEFTRIQAAEGDTLKITYIDDVNTTGASRTVTDTATVAVAATPTPTATPVTSPTATPTATPVTSPTPTPTPTPPVVTTGVITGTVSTGGVPIPGATVSTDTGGFTATTGPDGTYTIADVTAGDYTVTASATGFESSSQSVTVVAGAAATANFDLVQVPGPTPTVTVTPTPTEECKPESISATGLTLKRKKSGEVTVTVNGDICDVVADETVTATINAAGKKRISVSPTSASTDENGQATFTITAKNKTGSARVTFKAGDAKKSITVKVRK